MPATRIVCRALALATSKNQSVRLERRPTSQVGTIGGLRDLAVFVRAASIVPARQNYSNQRACRVRFTPIAKADLRTRSCPLWVSKADMCSAKTHVRYGPKRRHGWAIVPSGQELTCSMLDVRAAPIVLRLRA